MHQNSIKNYAFISLLTSNDYLPGLLVLNKTLVLTKTKFPFLVLLTDDISAKTISVLEKNNISYKRIETKIENPTDVDKNHRWFPTYSKLYIFDQTQYKKVVYLDVDMLILKNIDKLFKRKHMSAVNAGGMLPGKLVQGHFNSGLFVFKPSHKLFEDMVSKIGKIEKLESGGEAKKPRRGSDQDFLNAYFPNWPRKKELHLDHKYNMIHYYMDEYNKLFGYSFGGSKPISILHFASYIKPWNINKAELEEIKKDNSKKFEFKSINLWKDIYKAL